MYFWIGLMLAALVARLPDLYAETVHNPAEQIMMRVRDRLPTQPLQATGTLTVRQRRGIVNRRYRFDFFLDWGAEAPTTRYLVQDENGVALEELTLIREAAGTRWRYRQGEALVPSDPPPFTARIQQTDISWLDLSLDFLWWENPVIVGEETIKGFDCTIIRIPAPAAYRSEYAGVHLWISHEEYLLLQAEGVDEKGSAVRRLWVQSCQKIDDKWMIKEMEIQSFPARHRTRLHIEEVVEPTL